MKAFAARLERLEAQSNPRLLLVKREGESDRDTMNRLDVHSLPPRADVLFVITGVPSSIEEEQRGHRA